MTINPTLHNAIKAGTDWNQIQLLMKRKNAKLTDQDEKGRLPIHLAVRENKVDLLKYLIPKIEGRAHYDVKDKKGFSPISIAVKKGHLDCFEELENISGQDIAKIREGDNKENLLHLAIRKCKAQMLQFFLIKYPNESRELFKIANKAGDKPISLAANLGAFSEIRCLLDHNDTIENIDDEIFKSSYGDLEVDEECLQNPYLHFPQTLVFKGGGAKGIIYYGAIEALEEENILPFVKRVAGSSVGAITATMLAMGCTAAEIKKLVESTAGSKFMDWDMNYFNGNNDGWAVNSGHAFLEWIEKLIEEKTGIHHCTFGELKKLIEEGKPFKHLHVFATDLNNQKIKRFCSEIPEQENIIISEVVRASMAFPLLFAPHSIILKVKDKYVSESGRTESDEYESLKENLEGEIMYSDGGIAYNFPIDAFDRRPYSDSKFNTRVLGFSPCDIKEPIKEKKKSSIISEFYILQACKAKLLSAELRENFEPDEREERRVVQIFNCHIGTTDLIKTSPFYGEGQRGIKEGYETSKKFFEAHWYQLSNNFRKKRSMDRISHKFMLLKPNQNPTLNSLEEIKSLNPELNLLKYLVDKNFNDQKKKNKVARYLNKYPRFYSNYHVQTYLTQYLAIKNNEEYFKYLSDSDFLFNLKYNDGSSLIHDVLKNQKYNSFKALIKMTTDLKADALLDKNDNTILHVIAKLDDVKAFKILKAKPENLESLLTVKNKDGETPLLTAAKYGAENLIPELIEENGIDLTVKDRKTNKSILHYLVKRKWIGMASLIEKFIDKANETRQLSEIIRDSYFNSESVLFETKNLKVLKILMESGFDITRTEYSGKTLLVNFVEDNEIDMVKLYCTQLGRYPLKKRQYVLNAQICYEGFWGDTWHTALTIAAKNDYVEIVQLLIDHGADCTKHVDEKTPYSWAGRKSKQILKNPVKRPIVFVKEDSLSMSLSESTDSDSFKEVKKPSIQSKVSQLNIWQVNTSVHVEPKNGSKLVKIENEDKIQSITSSASNTSEEDSTFCSSESDSYSLELVKKPTIPRKVSRVNSSVHVAPKKVVTIKNVNVDDKTPD